MNLEGNLEKIREEFPLLNYYTFFNAASQTLPGKYWLKAMRECLQFQESGRIESIPVPDVASHPFLTNVFFSCIEEAAKLIHAKTTEVTNMYRVMTAANLIVNNMIEWRKDDNAVFTDLTYPSLVQILLNLSRRKGVKLRRIKNVNGEILLEDLEKNVDDDTKLVVVCHTTPFCGFTYNMKEVCRIAHEHNAFVLDDAFQAVGAIDVNVHNDNVDFLITGSYKWQCGPEGAGIFYIREDLIEKINPLFHNYIWADIPGGFPFNQPDHDNIKSWDYPLVKNANRFNQGVCITPTLFGWNSTLKFLNNLGIKNIEKRVRKLGGYLIERLKDINCKVLTPADPEKRHGLIMYTTGSHKRDLESFNMFQRPRLDEKPIKVSIRYLGGIGGIRVSTHFFNTEEEIDRLVEVQKRILK
ncbi:aminotransferase class V-fold PLP-dependent enzyme [Candidatus Bathyarchaeota archaeon]|nr:aminotransferase class V-fold PLP-dependent enzyme [Candidatus Bathyarchaeota archaeon]